MLRKTLSAPPTALSPISVLQAESTGSHQGTGGLSINTAGDIAGVYLDANYILQGFLYTP